MSRMLISVGISGWLSFIVPVQAADDAYLKMLESEAAELTLDHSGQLVANDTQQRAEPTFEWNLELEQEVIPSGLGMDQFEAFLQKYFYGTYVFFNKLNTTDKNTVYYRYSQAEQPDLENVRKNVMALLKQ